MAVDKVHPKKTPRVFSTYSVKTDFEIFPFIWAWFFGFWFFFFLIYQFAVGWLSVLDGKTFACGLPFLLNMYVGEGHYFFFLNLECTREIFIFFFPCSL